MTGISVRRLAGLLAGGWFYLAVAAVTALGLFAPGIADQVKALGPTPYLVVAGFFLNGLTLSTEALLGSLRKWRLVAGALIVMFLLAPALVLVARLAVPGAAPDLAIGFQLLAVIPNMLVSSVVITRIARGDGAVALNITVVANTLAVVAIPALLRATLGTSDIRMDVVGTATTLALTVLLPTLAGQVARWCWRRWAKAHDALFGALSRAVILMFVLTALSQVPEQAIPAAAWATALGLGAIFHAALLGAGNVAGRALRADGAERRALTLCASEKSMILAVFLWERLLGSTHSLALLPAIAYYYIELTADSALAEWWGRRGPEGPVNQRAATQ